MKKKNRRIYSLILVLALVMNILLPSVVSAQEVINEQKLSTKDIEITMSIERRVLGQADIVKPQKVKVKEGEKLSVVLDRILKENQIEYDCTGDLESSFYLSSMKIGDENLGEFDHGVLSGWMYSLNGEFPGTGMSSCSLKQGDNVRISYTAKGYGEDVKAVDNIYKLRELVNRANSIDPDKYTKDSIKVLQDALKVSQSKLPTDEEIGKMMSTTLGDGDCDIEEFRQDISNCINSITNALDNLQEDTEEANEAPVLTAKDREVNVGDKVDLLDGVSATDKEDGSVKVEVKDSELKLENGIATTPGEFKVTYFAIDSKSEETTKTVKFTVKENTNEKISLEEAVSKTKKYYKDRANDLTKWWDMVAATSLGEDISKSPYTLYEYKKDEVNENSRAIDDAGILIGIVSQGKDVKNYMEEGNNLAKVLADKQKSDGGFGGSMNYTIWSMLALEICNQEYNREQALDYLESKQTEQGGFNLSGGGSGGDVDITSMALLTLSFFDNAKSKHIIDKAIELLHSKQLENGEFETGWGPTNSNTVSIAIMGLVAVGEDINNSKWKNILDVQLAYQIKSGDHEGEFKWLQKDSGANDMATEQAAIAIGDALDGVSAWHDLANKYSEIEEANKNEAPVITAKDRVVNVGDKVDLLEGVIAVDKEDGSVKVAVKNSELGLDDGKATTPGDFRVTYSAKDSKGEEATKSVVFTVKETSIKPISNIKEDMDLASNWIIKNNPTPEFGDEWNIFGLARSGYSVPSGYYDTYYKNLVQTVKDKKGELSRSKYTEYSRTILALTAIGKDPTDVGGYNLVEKLYDFKNVSKQGINGVAFALIALDSQKYEIPKNVNNSREKMVENLLSQQLLDGGFALAGKVGDPDVTSMVIQALENYKNQPKVNFTINKAVRFLSDNQLANGGYNSWGTGNVESSSQVLVALSSLGIDAKSSDFVKNGNWIVSNMMKFRNEDGGFKHILEGKSDNIATEQVLYSLEAYQRYLNNENKLYDTTDVKINENNDNGSGEDTNQENNENNGDDGSNSGNNNEGNSNSNNSNENSGDSNSGNNGSENESNSENNKNDKTNNNTDNKFQNGSNKTNKKSSLKSLLKINEEDEKKDDIKNTSDNSNKDNKDKKSKVLSSNDKNFNLGYLYLGLIAISACGLVVINKKKTK